MAAKNKPAKWRKMSAHEVREMDAVLRERGKPLKIKKPAKKKLRRPKCGSKTGGSRVQSLVFSKTRHARGKPKWTPARARRWAEEHGYRAKKVDKTAGEYRLRQHAPGECTYRSVPFGKSGIRAIMELPKHVRRAVDEDMVRGRGRKR